jgi:hypothetical protein
MKRRGTTAKKLAFYVVIGPAATGANRKAGNNRRRTAREIFVVSFVSNFLCSRPKSQGFSYKSAILVLQVEANKAFDCVWLMLASAVERSVKIPMPRGAKL